MCRYIKLLRIAVFLFCVNIFTTVYAQESRWSRTGDCIVTRQGFAGTGFTDGKLMVIGSHTAAGINTSEIFDPATGSWSSLDASSHGGSHHMAMLLPNGKVLNIPGAGDCYLYDPRTESWTISIASITWFSKDCATLLKNGDVLLMYNGQDCVLYDYLGDAVTMAGTANNNRYVGVEILLPSGEVLLIGGFGIGTGTRTCELYDPVSRGWSDTDYMDEGRMGHHGILLPSPWNKVLAVGGAGRGVECELYDLAGKTWSYTGSLHYERSIGAMALLPSGKALMVGGSFQKICELYDPDGTTWTDTDSMEIHRSHFSLAILPTGKVLAIGGAASSATTNSCEIYDPSDGMWIGKPSLNVERAAHTVTPLPIIHIPGICSTNVLIAGGENLSGALKSCEVYNYSMDKMCVTDDLNDPRSHHTAILLVSGKVLVVGGKDGGALVSSELYTPASGTWTPTGNMTNARFDHSATLLKNGDVLVTGGEDAGTYLSSCETYNSGNWTPTANVMTTPRARHTAIILLDGNILVIGGQTSTGATASCELWDGSSWTGFPSISTARYWHTATLLQSGKVLVAGGTADGSNGLTSCEIFDPDSNKWFPEADLNTARYAHNTTILYSGLVLVTGGNGGSNSCETYDPATQGWTTDYTGTLITGRAYHSSVLITDTMPFILAIGGKSGASYLNSIEEYDVGLGYRSIWQSTITNYPAVTTITGGMNIQGTLFRGVSEADGGNYCHITSNDHPIISLVRVGGGNWQGNGGGEIMYMPLSSDWDETHTKVHPEITDFHGYYRLWSIVNGIPCKWYEECPAGIEESPQSTVHSPQLRVYPNPATTKTGVRFTVHSSQFTDKNRQPSTVNCQLKIYDLSGRLVRSLTIHDSQLTINEVTWDRRDSQGRKVKSGVYFYSVKYKDSENKGKFVILK